MARFLSLLALSLAVFVAAEAKALKYREISLPPGAIEMEVAIRQKGDSVGSSPVATMKLEINGDQRKVTLYDAADQMPPGRVMEVTRDEDFVPEVDSRYGIRAKRVCPIGYVRRGGVCFPED